jgi:hypothetical protein
MRKPRHRHPAITRHLRLHHLRHRHVPPSRQVRYAELVEVLRSAQLVVLSAAMRGKAPRLGLLSVALLQPPAEVPPALLAPVIDQRDNGAR